MDIIDRFLSKIKVNAAGCFEWQAKVAKNGYGYFAFGGAGKMVLAHRMSYTLFVGPVQDGLHVCHHCDNRRCVNPHHLFCGTQRENLLDAARKGRTASGLRHGTYTKPHTRTSGEKNGNRKLSESDVLQILPRYSSGESQRILARDFGVSQTAIHRLVIGKTWRHLSCQQTEV